MAKLFVIVSVMATVLLMQSKAYKMSRCELVSSYGDMASLSMKWLVVSLNPDLIIIKYIPKTLPIELRFLAKNSW